MNFKTFSTLFKSLPHPALPFIQSLDPFYLQGMKKVSEVQLHPLYPSWRWWWASLLLETPSSQSTNHFAVLCSPPAIHQDSVRISVSLYVPNAVTRESKGPGLCHEKSFFGLVSSTRPNSISEWQNNGIE
ncbi:hypothetical protein AVEN_259960-1 [Araneus ventricosus]|uniref:Uncharacterized protein n=1 Tax=Araneus ventricosus TaxID=182803 RepID=A0A4Y2VJ46_ARAVE|nr:hypothetical protein AVEN_259960-1 [Araneus ventricosus]